MNKALIGGIVGVLVVGYAGAGMYATSVAEEKIEAMITKAGNDGDAFSYGDVSATPFGEVTLQDVKIGDINQSITVDELVMDGLDEASGEYADIAITATGIRFTGFRIDETPDNPIEAMQTHVISNGGSLDFELNLTMDADDDIIDITTLALTSDGLGEIAFEGEFTGAAKALAQASKGFESENPQAGMMALMAIDKMTFEDLSLTLEDDGMVNILLESETNSRMPDIDDVRDDAVAKMEKAIERAQGMDKEFAKGALALLNGDGVSATLEEPLVLSSADFFGRSNALQRKLRNVVISIDTF